MTVESDFEFNERAAAIASDAMAWLNRNRSIEAMDNGDEPIHLHDYPESGERIWYTQDLMHSDTIRFGHVILRPNIERTCLAAVSPFQLPDRTVYVICAVSEYPASRTDILGAHVQETSFIHEATHALDFQRQGFVPKPFHADDIYDLGKRYYNLPHEYNAYFQQGLNRLIRDKQAVIGEVEYLKARGHFHPIRYFTRQLFSGRHWSFDFTAHLNSRYREKLLRRALRAANHLGLLT